jgi:hypothetical protein
MAASEMSVRLRSRARFRSASLSSVVNIGPSYTRVLCIARDSEV